MIDIPAGTKTLIVVLLLAAALNACAPLVTPMPTAVILPVPTQSPLPAQATLPTATPTPRATATKAPIIPPTGTIAWPSLTPVNALIPFTVLHDFSGQPGDGRIPYGVIVLSSGIFYGTTTFGGLPGGENSRGNVFRMNMDGSGFAELHAFAGGNADGWKPWSGLAISGGVIYGSTVYGGPYDEKGGVLYSMNLAGSAYRVLHTFGEPGDGFGASTSPVLVGTDLYGMTRWGGNGVGTIYKFDTLQQKYSQLYRFAADGRAGSSPLGTLTAPGDGFLYGLTWLGGAHDLGTLFRIRLDGSAFETLHHFSGNLQGAYPYDSLVFDSDHTLYGTTLGTYGNDSSDLGTIFKFDIASGAYTVLHNFAGGPADSVKPNGSVVLFPDGLRLFGVTHGDDAWGGKELGALYQMNVDGTGFKLLHEFTGGMHGATPMRTPILVNGSLYGMTAYGGAKNYGIIYRFQVPR